MGIRLKLIVLRMGENNKMNEIKNILKKVFEEIKHIDE